MNRMKLIGLCGYKMSGKSTVAKMLSDKGFLELTFAGPLKRACQEIYSLSDEQLYTEKKEEIDPHWQVTPREIMQRFGTDVMRNNASVIIPDMKSEDIWIEVMNRKVNKLVQSGEVNKIVVSDVRFPNEASWIRQRGGTLIKVQRYGMRGGDTHESEQIAFEPDHVLDNTGKLEWTQSNLDSILWNMYHLDDHQPFLL
jgi:uridine kinase